MPLVWVWFPVAFAFSLGVLVLRRGLPNERVGRFALETFPLLGLLVLGFAGCYQVLRFLPEPGRSLSAFAAVGLSAGLVSHPWLRRWEADASESREHLRWVATLGMRRVFVDAAGVRVRPSLSHFGWLALRLASSHVLLPLTLASLAAPWLVQCVAQPGPVRLASGAALPASAVVSLGLMVLVGPCLLLVFVLDRVFRKRSSETLFERAGPLLLTLRHLDLPAVRRDSAQRLANALPTIGPAPPAVLSRPPRIPLLRRTCDILQAATEFGFVSDQLAAIRGWVASCAHSTGGFGPMPGMPPELPHTLWTLRALQGSGGCGSPALHVKWLRRQMLHLLRSRHSLAPGEWLQALGYCPEAGRLVGMLGPKCRWLRAAVSQRGFQAWLSSRRTTRATLGLLGVLPLDRSGLEACFAWLAANWLPEAEGRWTSLLPDIHLEELAEALEVLSRLHPQSYRDSACVRRLADSLEKAHPPGLGARPPQTP